MLARGLCWPAVHPLEVLETVVIAVKGLKQVKGNPVWTGWASGWALNEL
jgi:hypothetical protein